MRQPLLSQAKTISHEMFERKDLCAEPQNKFNDLKFHLGLSGNKLIIDIKFSILNVSSREHSSGKLE